MVAAVGSCREVEIATYMFDDAELFEVLLARLRDNSGFSLRMNIDAETLKGGTPAQQRSQLDRLRKAGAKVYECKGSGRLGAYHVKELIVNRRLMFTGSANFTTKARQNRERTYRMTGASVTESLKDQAEKRSAGKLSGGL